MTPNELAYYKLSKFVETGSYYLKTSEITKQNWQEYYDGIMNLMRDGIETDFLQGSFITVDFGDNDIVDMSVFDLYINMVFWYPIVMVDQVIDGRHLHFYDAETKGTIKYFLDKYVIDADRKTIDSIMLNNMLADTTHKFIESDEFSMYLANTINLKDTIDLMNACKEFDEILHTKMPNVPIQDVKDKGMELANRSIEIIKESAKYMGYEHCLANSFRAQEGINPRQYKEYAVHIGSKPNGQGGVHPSIIDGSYIGGALDSIEAQFMDSNSSRVAQILMKNNTGDSGGFARILGLNNIDSFLMSDPHYDCHTHNFEEIVIKSNKVLERLVGRYYRTDPEGIEYLIGDNDVFLIGTKIYLRSPMTCASAARGNGVCFHCYGDLAYTNRNIKPGKYAAENVSSKLTQRQLSAKHLLETMIVALKWAAHFLDYFTVNGNVVQLNNAMEFTKGYTLIFDAERIEYVNEDDYVNNEDGFEDIGRSDYNEFIRHCTLETPDGKIIDIGTEDGVPMYFTNELKYYMNEKGVKDEDNTISVDIHNIVDNYNDFPMFLIKYDNNELNKTLDDIQNLINMKDIVQTHNRNNILQDMIDLLIEGKLNIMSVHMEMILMNQIRNATNILEKPNWANPNEPYQLLTLDQALSNNPSITISLLYQNLDRVLYNPLSFKKTAPNPMDLFFMPQPQNFLGDTKNIVKTKDKEELVCPVIRYRVKDKEE